MCTPPNRLKPFKIITKYRIIIEEESHFRLKILKYKMCIVQYYYRLSGYQP